MSHGEIGDLGHVVVIGGGIAGVSTAYHLAKTERCDRITLLEAESQLSYHTTGRSAALLTENYGAGPIRPLTTASLDFLQNPPSALIDHPIITKRGIMTVATTAQDHLELDRQLKHGESAVHTICEIDTGQAEELAPHVVFGPDHRVMWEEHAFDIDVAALHQAFVRGFRALDGNIEVSRRVDAAVRDGDRWIVETVSGQLSANLIVNAAGAWADLVATRAGVTPVGLTPLKRTAFMVASPLTGSSEFAFVAEIRHAWYLRPDGDQFMCSPADEQPSAPCDAKANELDIARTIEMLNDNTRLAIRSVKSHWAGLRTFSPDRAMVIGPDPQQPSFIWCAGQGGTGIQTSPGAGRLVADLVTAGTPSSHFGKTELDLPALLPDRFVAEDTATC